jgi:hypothetical protein
LPLYPRMSAQDQQDVIDAVHRIIATHRQ